jgi:hypothetical protein
MTRNEFSTEKLGFAPDSEPCFAAEVAPFVSATPLTTSNYATSQVFMLAPSEQAHLAESMEATRAELEADALANPYKYTKSDPDANYFTNRAKNLFWKAIAEIRKCDQPWPAQRTAAQIDLKLPATGTSPSEISHEMIPDIEKQFVDVTTKVIDINRLVRDHWYFNSINCPTASLAIAERINELDPDTGYQVLAKYISDRKYIDSERSLQWMYEARARKAARDALIEESKGWSASHIVATVATGGGYDASLYVGRQIQTGITIVGKRLSDIPILGKPLQAVCGLAIGPVVLYNNIATGTNVKKAFLDDFHQEIANVSDVAWIAKIVISYIPAIGPGVACAIGVGLALAQGKSIDRALLEGIAGAVPPQPFAEAAIMAIVDLSMAAANGTRLSDAVINSSVNTIAIATKMGDAGKAGLKIGLGSVTDICQGDNVIAASTDNILGQLPPNARTAVQVVIALGSAQKVQVVLFNAIQSNPNVLVAIGEEGAKYTAKVPIFKEMVNQIPTAVTSTANQAAALANKSPALVKKGFNYGIGMMRSSGVTNKMLALVRSKLGIDEQAGYDLALAAYSGAVVAPSLPPSISLPAQAGYIATKGATLTPLDTRLMITGLVKTEPEMKAGATLAAKQYADQVNTALIEQALSKKTSPTLASLQVAITKAAIMDVTNTSLPTPEQTKALIPVVGPKISFWAKFKAFFSKKV